jgi:hypothetical protein
METTRVLAQWQEGDRKVVAAPRGGTATAVFREREPADGGRKDFSQRVIDFPLTKSLDEGDVRLPIVVAKSMKESARSEVARGGGGEGRLEAVEVVATRVDSGGGVPVIEW